MAFVLRATGSNGRGVDEQELRRALAVLPDPRHGVELLALPAARRAALKGGDVAGAVAAARSLADGAKGVYYRLNPVSPDLAKAANNGDILARRWLLVDLDPVKPEAEQDNSATDDEHEKARLVAAEVMDYLDGQGWPAPALIDSGNGWHLLYRVDLPNNDHARALLRGVLYHLKDRFSGDRAIIDKGVFRANQLAKLPGTWACKGKPTDERPHRPVRFLHCPGDLEIVTPDQLSALAPAEAAPAAPAAETVVDRGFVLRTGGDRLKAYARKALQGECARVSLAIAGPKEGRNNALYLAARNMGEIVAAGGITRSEVERELRVVAILRSLGEVEVDRTLKSGIEKGMETPRQIPERNGHTPGPALKAEAEIPEGETIIVRASSIKPRKVEWLWPGRIPLGKLTTFAGAGGLGKTFVLCDITARVTRGLDWPDSQGECCDEGQVLFVSGEDDPDDTLVPRLIELGADLDKVVFLKSEYQDRFTLADLPMLDRAIAQAGPSVRFVAIDPPTAFLGGADDHKNAELRSLLSPLKSWASRNRVAVVFNTHINKGQGKVEAMMRVMGSVAWVNAVRAAHLFAKDPEDPARRFFVGMKVNITAERKGLAYKITPAGDDMARVEWLGQIDTTADEAVNRERPRQRRDRAAADWLVEKFREKREWYSDELKRAASAEGVSHNALFEAKKLLDLPRARRVVEESGNVTWVWWVPEDWPPLQPPAEPEAF